MIGYKSSEKLQKIQSPCRDCENVGCGEYHDKCKLYKHFRQELELERLEEKNEKERKYFKRFKRY